MIRLTFLLFIICIGMIACKTPPEEPILGCQENPLGLSVRSFMDTPCGDSTGFIEVEGTGGIGEFEFAINSGDFSLSNIFEELSSGVYQVKVRDERGCVETIPVSLLSGTSFEGDVLPLINASCAIESCHVTGAEAPDLSIRDNIFTEANRIGEQLEINAMPPKDSAVDSLTRAEAQVIICWVREGGLDN